MKRFVCILMTAAMAALCLVSCDKDPKTDSLTGDWSMNKIGLTYDGVETTLPVSMFLDDYVSVNFDGKGSGKVSFTDIDVTSYVETLSFQYVYSAPTLSITSEGETVDFTVVQLDESNLVISASPDQDFGLGDDQGYSPDLIESVRLYFTR